MNKDKTIPKLWESKLDRENSSLDTDNKDIIRAISEVRWHTNSLDIDKSEYKNVTKISDIKKEGLYRYHGDTTKYTDLPTGSPFVLENKYYYVSEKDDGKYLIQLLHTVDSLTYIRFISYSGYIHEWSKMLTSSDMFSELKIFPIESAKKGDIVLYPAENKFYTCFEDVNEKLSLPNSKFTPFNLKDINSIYRNIVENDMNLVYKKRFTIGNNESGYTNALRIYLSNSTISDNKWLSIKVYINSHYNYRNNSIFRDMAVMYGMSQSGQNIGCFSYVTCGNTGDFNPAGSWGETTKSLCFQVGKDESGFYLDLINISVLTSGALVLDFSKSYDKPDRVEFKYINYSKEQIEQFEQSKHIF